MMNQQQFQRQDGQKQVQPQGSDKDNQSNNQQTTINGMSLQEHALKQYYQSMNNKQMMQNKQNTFGDYSARVRGNDQQPNMMHMLPIQQQDKDDDNEGSQQDQNQDLQQMDQNQLQMMGQMGQMSDKDGQMMYQNMGMQESQMMGMGMNQNQEVLDMMGNQQQMQDPNNQQVYDQNNDQQNNQANDTQANQQQTE